MPGGVQFGNTGRGSSGGGGAGGLTLISDVSVPFGSSQASIAFNAIPGTYKHLKLIMACRTDYSGANDDLIMMQINGSGGASYSSQVSGNSALTSQTKGIVGVAASSLAPTSYSGLSELLIPDYTNAQRYLAYFSSISLWFTATAPFFAPGSGATGFATVPLPVTSIVLTPQNGTNFTGPSRATLYGMG